MIDWNKPLVTRADPAVRVWLVGMEEGLYLVQDSRGVVARFKEDGSPFGHISFIKNDEGHLLPVRTRLAAIMLARAEQLLDQEDEAMQDHHLWGAF